MLHKAKQLNITGFALEPCKVEKMKEKSKRSKYRVDKGTCNSKRGDFKLYKTIPVRLKLNSEESAYWLDQCQHANSLFNQAVYLIRQEYYSRIELDNAYTTYWVGDDFRQSIKHRRINISYGDLCYALKWSEHYGALYSQSAQQVLKTVAESLTSYNELLAKFFSGQLKIVPRLLRYRKSGGLNAISFPRQALECRDGYFHIPSSLGTKSQLLTDIVLPLPDFIDSDWVKEVTIRPSRGEFWVDWVIDDGQVMCQMRERNPVLDYSQAMGIDHGISNWLSAVTTTGKSFIVDGKQLKTALTKYAHLVAKQKAGKHQKYWDLRLDKLTAKRNLKVRDAVNKAARFLVNRCLKEKIGNIVIGWNEGNKTNIDIGRKNNYVVASMPTKRLIDRLKQLCAEYGIKLILTEESYTSKASYLELDELPRYGAKPKEWKPSGQRVKRGLYKTSAGFLINADLNAAANILRKVTIQLGLNLAKVVRGCLTVPHRYSLFNDLTKQYRKTALRSVELSHVVTKL